jgi:hypothetical protein
VTGKKRVSKRRNRPRRDNQSIMRVPDAYKPIEPIFDALYAMSDASHTYAAEGGPFDTPGRRLELAIFMRMINSLKSATQLLQNGHWEFASPIVRHLYEMALNIDHLYSFADRDQAVLRYVRFGTLQEIFTRWTSWSIARAPDGPSTQVGCVVSTNSPMTSASSG